MNFLVFSESEWGRPLPADDERAVHVREVLRAKPGQALRVAMLERGMGEAVCRFGPGGGLELEFPDPAALRPAPPPLPLTVLLGHPRPPVMQRLLKDLNASGAARVFVAAAELGEKSYLQSRLWRDDGAGRPACRRFLEQGAQQGGQAFLCQTRRFYSLNRAVDALHPAAEAAVAALGQGEAWPADRPAPYGDPPAGAQIRLRFDLGPGLAPLLDLAAAWAREWRGGASPPAGGVVAAVGPERGWTERERDLLDGRGFVGCGLGDRILRTETACNLAVGVLAMALDRGR